MPSLPADDVSTPNKGARTSLGPAPCLSAVTRDWAMTKVAPAGSDTSAADSGSKLMSLARPASASIEMDWSILREGACEPNGVRAGMAHPPLSTPTKRSPRMAKAAISLLLMGSL